MQGLKKSSDFKEVYKKRDLRADDRLVLYKLKNDIKENRYGISVSKRVGNSIVRHRLKRQLREICRLNDCFIKKSFDFVIVIRPKACGMPYSELEKSFCRLALRHRLLLK